MSSKNEKVDSEGQDGPEVDATSEATEPVVLEDDAEEITPLDQEDPDFSKNRTEEAIAGEQAASQSQSGSRSRGLHPFVWALVGSAVSLIVVGGIYAVESRPNGIFDNNSASLLDLQARMDTADAAFELYTETLSEKTARIETLTDELANAGARIAVLEEGLQSQPDHTEALTSIDQRLTDLENRPIPDIGATQDAVDAYERELTAMRQMLAEELERIRVQSDQTASLAEQAVAADKNSTARLIADDIRDAIQNGQPLTPHLNVLASKGFSVPGSLLDNANSIPSLAELQGQLADAARKVVADEVRQKAQSGEIGRVEAFLRLQLGARSLAPGQGDSAEQVLARAEAALRKSDAAGALTEVQNLNSDSQELGNWIDAAQQYVDAMDAANEIAAQSE